MYTYVHLFLCSTFLLNAFWHYVVRVPSKWNSPFMVSKYRTVWSSMSPMSTTCPTHPILLYLAAAIITRKVRIMNVSVSSNTMLRRVFQLDIFPSTTCSQTLQCLFLQDYIFPYLCVYNIVKQNSHYSTCHLTSSYCAGFLLQSFMPCWYRIPLSNILLSSFTCQFRITFSSLR
jgi:hypothetical protein